MLHEQIAFSASAMFGILSLTYTPLAKARGWAIGTVFRREFSFVHIFALHALIAGFFGSIFVTPWYTVLIAVAAISVVAAVVIEILKHLTQPVCIVLTPPLAIYSSVLIVEHFF